MFIMSSTYLSLHEWSHILWLKNCGIYITKSACFISMAFCDHSGNMRQWRGLMQFEQKPLNHFCNIPGMNKSSIRNLTFSVTFSIPVSSSWTILLICLALLRLSSGNSWWCSMCWLKWESGSFQACKSFSITLVSSSLLQGETIKNFS